MKWICTVFLNGLFLQTPSLADEISLQIGEHHIRATLANRPLSRETGLKNTKQLCRDCGMIFVFPKKGKYKFWMKNTPLSLSIAFIDTSGHILEIDEMQANTLNLHSAQEEVFYALEMKQGWFTEHAVNVHSYVQGLHNAPPGE